jgi:hypothetical protein
MTADRGLEDVAHVASIAERGAPWNGCQDFDEPRDHHVVDVVVGRRGHHPEDRGQLVVGVVGEVDGRAETALESGVLRDEDRHRERVARDDDHQVVALVLHLLDQGVDRLGAVLVA